MEAYMTLRIILSYPGHRGVIVDYHPVSSLRVADLVGPALVRKPMTIVDLLDLNGKILRSYRSWDVK